MLQRIAPSLIALFIAIAPSAVLAAPADSTFTAEMAAGDSTFHAFDNSLAREHYARAVAIDSTSYDALWKLSRAYTDCAAAAPRDKQDALSAESERLARKCVALYPDSAQAHFTLALALGRMANLAGGKRRIALSKEIKHEADSTLDLNKGCKKAPCLAKVIYGGIPQGASMERARAYFEQAIALDPKTPINHYWLGETLIKLKDYPGARAELERCIELDDVLWDDKRTKEKAQKSLEDIKGKK